MGAASVWVWLPWEQPDKVTTAWKQNQIHILWFPQHSLITNFHGFCYLNTLTTPNLLQFWWGGVGGLKL